MKRPEEIRPFFKRLIYSLIANPVKTIFPKNAAGDFSSPGATAAPEIPFFPTADRITRFFIFLLSIRGISYGRLGLPGSAFGLQTGFADILACNRTKLPIYRANAYLGAGVSYLPLIIRQTCLFCCISVLNSDSRFSPQFPPNII